MSFRVGQPQPAHPRDCDEDPTPGDRVSRRTAWNLAPQLGCDLRGIEYLAATKLQADALVTTDAHLVALADGIVPVAGFDALTP